MFVFNSTVGLQENAEPVRPTRARASRRGSSQVTRVFVKVDNGNLQTAEGLLSQHRTLAGRRRTLQAALESVLSYWGFLRQTEDIYRYVVGPRRSQKSPTYIWRGYLYLAWAL